MRMAARRLLPLFLLLFLSADPARAEDVPEIAFPEELSPAIDYLLSLLGPDQGVAFEPGRIAPLLDYLLASRPGPLYYEAGGHRDATSAAIPFTLKIGLEKLLHYGFNPAIPSHVVTPSSLRLARWTAGEEGLVRLREGFPPSGRPVIVRGTEHEEITPNLATGTYFTYDLDRAVLLFLWNGRPLLINLSRQQDRSTVGKQGAVLGADADWDYFYSGEKGVARAGLGWVDSYMYSSFSIGLFYDAGEGLIRGAICKWLNAGWLGLNLVNRRHIYDGLVRYVRDLHQVLEDPLLPPAEELADCFSCLADFPAEKKRNFFRHYLDSLDRRYADGEALPGKFARLLRSESYTRRLSPEEMEAALALEQMKCRLGRGCSDPQLAAACKGEKTPGPLPPALP
jgi:hypothetical protein